MQKELIKYIEGKGHKVSIIDSVLATYAKQILVQKWQDCEEGTVLLMFKTNPQTFFDSRKQSIYKLVHQIDGPPKFTFGDMTVLRKAGELKLRDGVVEFEGFDLMREVILHAVSYEEAIKIIDGWK